MANLAYLGDYIAAGDFQQDNGDIVMTTAVVRHLGEILDGLIAIA